MKKLKINRIEICRVDLICNLQIRKNRIKLLADRIGKTQAITG
jgi:hypothetical protein